MFLLMNSSLAFCRSSFYDSSPTSGLLLRKSSGPKLMLCECVRTLSSADSVKHWQFRWKVMNKQVEEKKVIRSSRHGFMFSSSQFSGMSQTSDLRRNSEEFIWSHECLFLCYSRWGGFPLVFICCFLLYLLRYSPETLLRKGERGSSLGLDSRVLPQ